MKGNFGRLQLTLALLKPDVAVQPLVIQDIRSRILQNNFYVIQSERFKLSRRRAEDFYSTHRGRFFFDRLINYMSSGPVEGYILAKENAIKDWRKLMGPTKVFKTIFSDPTSIRGQFGLTDTRNSAHGSDSDESAKQEVEFFFPNFNYNAWYDDEEPRFHKGAVIFDPERFIHVPT